MSTLPTTTMEVNEQPRTNRKVVSAVSIGLAVFGCSMLVSNMKSTSVEIASEVTPAQPVRSLTGYIPSSSAENLIKSAGNPSKSPSAGLHKPTWKPSSKPAEHRGLESKKEKKEIKSEEKQDMSVKKEAKTDMKDMKKEIKTDKKEMKSIKSEIKSDKMAIKEDKEIIINEETGRPYGLDEVGIIHAPKLGSKLGQVEGEVVEATSRKDAKDLVKVTYFLLLYIFYRIYVSIVCFSSLFSLDIFFDSTSYVFLPVNSAPFPGNQGGYHPLHHPPQGRSSCQGQQDQVQVRHHSLHRSSQGCSSGRRPQRSFLESNPRQIDQCSEGDYR